MLESDLIKSLLGILFVGLGALLVGCAHSGSSKSPYGPFYRRIDALISSAQGVDFLTIEGLRTKLGLKAEGKQVIYPEGTQLPGVVSRYVDLRFEDVQIDDIFVKDIVARVEHDQTPHVDRIRIVFSAHSCVDGAALRVRYGMGRDYIPEAGPEAKEALYSARIGHGKIWLSSPIRDEQSSSPCVTSMGLIFSAP